MNLHPNSSRLPEYKLAKYWVSKGAGVSCLLCPHHCFLNKDQVGVCGTRANKQGELVALTYGYPCALHVDPVEKKPLYHFLPGSTTFSISTVGCNLSCLNCQNYSISQARFHKDAYPYVSADEVVRSAISHKCKSISYTYTDPVVYYEYAMDIAQIAKKHGLKNIMVSAGYIHKKPLRELCGCIDAANIDLKCFDRAVYDSLSGIRMSHVLDSLQLLLEERVWLEITNLLVPGYSDDLKMVEKMCVWLMDNGFMEVPLHFSRFHPSYKLSTTSSTSLLVMTEAFRIAKDSGLKYVYLGNVRQLGYSQTYCSRCNEALVWRDGYDTKLLAMEAGRCSNCGNEISGVWS